MAINYAKFMALTSGFRITSSNGPLDGRSVVELDEQIKLIPYPYIGQMIYSIESETFFVVKSLKDGWEELATGIFFDVDPNRPISEVRKRKNSLVDEYVEFSGGSGTTWEVAEIVSGNTELKDNIYLIVDDIVEATGPNEIKLSDLLRKFPNFEEAEVGKKVEIKPVNLAYILEKLDKLERIVNTLDIELPDPESKITVEITADNEAYAPGNYKVSNPIEAGSLFTVKVRNNYDDPVVITDDFDVISINEEVKLSLKEELAESKTFEILIKVDGLEFVRKLVYNFIEDSKVIYVGYVMELSEHYIVSDSTNPDAYEVVADDTLEITGKQIRLKDARIMMLSDAEELQIGQYILWNPGSTSIIEEELLIDKKNFKYEVNCEEFAKVFVKYPNEYGKLNKIYDSFNGINLLNGFDIINDVKELPNYIKYEMSNIALIDGDIFYFEF